MLEENVDYKEKLSRADLTRDVLDQEKTNLMEMFQKTESQKEELDGEGNRSFNYSAGIWSRNDFTTTSLHRFDVVKMSTFYNNCDEHLCWLFKNLLIFCLAPNVYL